MTRDEAIEIEKKKLKKIYPSDLDFNFNNLAAASIDALIELGLLKVDEPKKSDPIYDYWYAKFANNHRWTDNNQEQWKKYSADMAKRIADYVKEKVNEEASKWRNMERRPGTSSDGWD